MAYREVPRMEIREVIRRWQAGVSQGRIAGGGSLLANTRFGIDSNPITLLEPDLAVPREHTHIWATWLSGLLTGENSW